MSCAACGRACSRHRWQRRPPSASSSTSMAVPSVDFVGGLLPRVINQRTMVDPMWEHGHMVKGGFRCKYCWEKKSGGGATRFKEHLVHRGSNMKDCPSVPPDVKAFFIEQLDRNKARSVARARFFRGQLQHCLI
ncbi:hypothetical protein U9M48_029060 [Paspalum notatum var. saurae]|uniref:BED-type domain-containing protein n=1 Tax=Paspalum notatum var. saurae TaxID=547442 RepID=A0AAQ3X1Z4_PASNO